MENAISPHDRYFRQQMSNLRIAKDFFSHHLPKKIKNEINLNALQLCKESFIDEQFGLSITDILYSVNIKEQASYIYILVEHQSSPDVLMPFRILNYMCKIMDYHLRKNKSKELPLIVPLVFYHGEKKYSCSTDIFDLFGENKKLAEDFLFKPFKLIDVTQIPDEEIRKHTWSGIMEFVMKHIYTRDFLPYFKEMKTQFETIVKLGEKDYIAKATINYLMWAGNIVDKQCFAEILEKNFLTVDVKEEAMTLREMWLEEGKQEGLQMAINTMAKRLLARGDSYDQVKEVTGLSIQEIIQLKNIEKISIP